MFGDCVHALYIWNTQLATLMSQRVHSVCSIFSLLVYQLVSWFLVEEALFFRHNQLCLPQLEQCSVHKEAAVPCTCKSLVCHRVIQLTDFWIPCCLSIFENMPWTPLYTSDFLLLTHLKPEKSEGIWQCDQNVPKSTQDDQILPHTITPSIVNGITQLISSVRSTW